MARYIGKFQTPTEGFGIQLSFFPFGNYLLCSFRYIFVFRSTLTRFKKKVWTSGGYITNWFPNKSAFFCNYVCFYIRSIYDLKMPQVKIMKIKIIRINTSNCINRFHNQCFYHSQLMWKQTEISDATITKNFQTEL